jgi:hypothetical protein
MDQKLDGVVFCVAVAGAAVIELAVRLYDIEPIPVFENIIPVFAFF